MAVLLKVNGNPPGQLIELKDDETSIGRLPECSVTLDLQGVSRKHAIIKRSGKDFYLVDLRSRNKTFLNEREIPPEEDQLLRQGDRILICDVEMVFYQTLPTEPEIEERDQVVVTEGVDDSTICTLDASRSDLIVCAVRPEAKLKAILDITRNLSSSLELDTVAPKILDSLLEIFPQAERVFLVLLKQGEAKPTIRQTYHKNRPYKRTGAKAPLGRPTGDESRLSISRTIMNAVLNQKKAVLSQDAGNDQNLPTSASIADLRIRSFMCAPLLTPDGQALGILQIDTTDRKQFVQDDLDVLLAVASQAAIAVQNADMHENILARERLDRDMRLAEQVQRRFLPQSVPKVDGYEFHAYYQSFYEVGGDYYDFVPLPGNRLAVALGDVSGKGVAAALMMAKFSGDTRYCILTQNHPGPAADRLNSLLYEAGFDERFITLCLGVLDLSDGLFTFASAGHLPVLVRRSDGRVEALGQEISGLPLGIMPESRYAQIDTRLKPGDVAVIYSDGVTDARNPRGELYDTSDNPRLSRRIAAAPGSPETVGKAIIQDIREFSAGQYQTDDITLVCFGPLGR
jgi:sigma-B regulation protein RsbU (phosphoserine phosphatase)